MNKISKSLLVLFLAFLFGSCFSVYSVNAQNNKLILEVIEECEIQYAGDTCVAELKLTNNTGETLDGKASLHIDYQGICEDGFFDGNGIEAQFSYNGDDNWLNFSGWENGTAIVSGFDIADGETLPKLKIETVPNLCPGKYTFNLEIQGSDETEETYTAGTIIGGSGGTPVPGLTIIKNPQVTFVPEDPDNNATVKWTTSYRSTSQVVYSSVDEPHTFSYSAINYGYAHAYPSPEDFTKKVNHTVVIPGLIQETTYYYRVISHASPATVSREYTFVVPGVKGASTETQGDEQSAGGQGQEPDEGQTGDTGIGEKIVQGVTSILGLEEKETLSLEDLDNLGLLDSEEVGVLLDDIEEKDLPLDMTADLSSAFSAFFDNLRESFILLIAIIFFLLLLILAVAKLIKDKKKKENN